MSFTDRKAFVLTEDVRVDFKRTRKRFHCKLCGHEFHSGDVLRWIYANGTADLGCGNFFVCAGCDGEDSEVLKRAKGSFSKALRLARQWDLTE